MLKPLSRNGISTIGELMQQYEHENNRNLLNTMKFIISAMPKILIHITQSYNEEINQDNGTLTHIMIAPNVRKVISSVTVKELQITLKNAMNRIEDFDANKKLGITSFKEEFIIEFRERCKNSKLRNIYFRLIHNDFFTKVKLKKFKMILSDKCERCEEVETTNHLLWGCRQAKNIWTIYNRVMINLGMPSFLFASKSSIRFIAFFRVI